MSETEKKLLVLDTSYSLEDIQKRGIINSVTCRDISGYFSKVWTVHPFATLVTSAAWAPRNGVPVYHQLNSRHVFVEGKIGRYNWPGLLSPLNFLFSQIQIIRQLRKLIRIENISLIRCGDPLYLGLVGWVLSKLCNIPFVIRVGGNHDKVFESTGKPLQKRVFFSRKIEKIVERFVFKRADLVAGANKDNLNFALANGARKEVSTIFRYGNLLYKGHFDEPSLRQEGKSLLQSIGIGTEELLLYIGRLEAVKCPDHVLYVLHKLIGEKRNIKALVVGEGAMLNELKALARTLHIEGNVVFAGNQNQEWLSRVIPLSTVVVSPHTGRALSEAALGGGAIVGYDVDWQGEIIINNETGLLVEYGNIDLFFAAVRQMLEQPLFANKMRKNIRRKALAMLDPVKLDDHEKSEYDKLLSRFSRK